MRRFAGSLVVLAMAGGMAWGQEGQAVLWALQTGGSWRTLAPYSSLAACQRDMPRVIANTAAGIQARDDAQVSLDAWQSGPDRITVRRRLRIGPDGSYKPNAEWTIRYACFPATVQPR